MPIFASVAVVPCIPQQLEECNCTHLCLVEVIELISVAGLQPFGSEDGPAFSDSVPDRSPRHPEPDARLNTCIHTLDSIANQTELCPRSPIGRRYKQEEKLKIGLDACRSWPKCCCQEKCGARPTPLTQLSAALHIGISNHCSSGAFDPCWIILSGELASHNHVTEHTIKHTHACICAFWRPSLPLTRMQARVWLGSPSPALLPRWRHWDSQGSLRSCRLDLGSSLASAFSKASHFH